MSAETSQSRRSALKRDAVAISYVFILSFVMQEGDGAKPKTVSFQRLSPKWCFLDCEYPPPLGAGSDDVLAKSFGLPAQWK